MYTSKPNIRDVRIIDYEGALIMEPSNVDIYPQMATKNKWHETHGSMRPAPWFSGTRVPYICTTRSVAAPEVIRCLDEAKARGSRPLLAQVVSPASDCYSLGCAIVDCVQALQCRRAGGVRCIPLWAENIVDALCHPQQSQRCTAHAAAEMLMMSMHDK
jgi:hypothetical protein